MSDVLNTQAQATAEFLKRQYGDKAQAYATVLAFDAMISSDQSKCRLWKDVLRLLDEETEQKN